MKRILRYLIEFFDIFGNLIEFLDLTAVKSYCPEPKILKGDPRALRPLRGDRRIRGNASTYHHRLLAWSLMESSIA